jgi:2-hydroxycyclohexanecarboxyl-CoA dehydrogenase
MAEKVALVTGAAAGIGAAVSRRFARDGIAVGVLDVNVADATTVANDIRSEGGKAIPLGASVADRGAVTAAVARLREAFGPVTIVVNNAGITGTTPFEDLTDQQWDRMMEVNLKGTFIVTQTVLPDMKAAKWGRIINISSSSAQTGAVNMAHYSASKGAIIALTRTLARELGPLGITVNNVPPGSVSQTVMFEAHRAKNKTDSEAFMKSIPVGRMGVPDDIAGACAWLVSEGAGYVSGQTIGVNGGRVVS